MFVVKNLIDKFVGNLFIGWLWRMDVYVIFPVLNKLFLSSFVRINEKINEHKCE